jgi:hypothetical protein
MTHNLRYGEHGLPASIARIGETPVSLEEFGGILFL